jgi:hypothetical protein
MFVPFSKFSPHQPKRIRHLDVVGRREQAGSGESDDALLLHLFSVRVGGDLKSNKLRGDSSWSGWVGFWG